MITFPPEMYITRFPHDKHMNISYANIAKE